MPSRYTMDGPEWMPPKAGWERIGEYQDYFIGGDGELSEWIVFVELAEEEEEEGLWMRASVPGVGLELACHHYGTRAQAEYAAKQLIKKCNRK